MQDFAVSLIPIMIVLAPIQVISAFVAMLVSSNQSVKKHFAIYLIGVVAYFLILFFLLHISEIVNLNGFGWIFFLFGAWGLAFYHLVIALAGPRLP